MFFVFFPPSFLVLFVENENHTVYERPGWFHAWDTADRLTNWMLFKIQRHPDHHTNAGRPYQILRTFAQSPTMPTGYAGMVRISYDKVAFAFFSHLIFILFLLASLFFHGARLCSGPSWTHWLNVLTANVRKWNAVALQLLLFQKGPTI